MAQYRIDELLANSVQPFDNYTPDQLAAFGEGFGDALATAPIMVANTKPPILVSGNQRCLLYKSRGRVVLEGHEVVVANDVTTREQAYERAVTVGVNVREISVEKKVALARGLQAEKGWSQGRLAKLFGVSQPAVSQWLAKVPGAAPPAEVIGADGKTYSTPARPAQPAPIPESWDPAQVDAAISYLNGISRQSNLGKIGGQLAALEAYCSQDNDLSKQWNETFTTFDDADAVAGAGFGAEPEERQEARENLENTVESLLDDIERYRQEHNEDPADSSADDEPAATPAVAPESKLTPKEKAAATRAAKKAEKERTERQTLMGAALDRLEHARRDLLKQIAGTERFADVADQVDRLEAAKAADVQAWSELADRQPPSRVEEFERLAALVSDIRRAVETGLFEVR